MADNVSGGAVIAVVANALSFGFSLLQARKLDKVSSDLKRQRIEVYTIEGCCVAAILSTFIESRLSKKKLQCVYDNNMQRIDMLEVELNDVITQVRSLNISALDAKLDMIVSATATPKIIPDTDVKSDKYDTNISTKYVEKEEEESGA